MRHWAVQLIDLLDYLHANDYVARNLSPENLYVAAAGRIYFLDPFLALPVEYHPVKASMHVPEYAAPEEVCQSGTADADWWRLGVLLYECMTGVTPVCSDARVGHRREEEVMSLLARFDPNELDFPPHLSKAACALIRSLLCREPSDRPGAATGRADFALLPWFAGDAAANAATANADNKNADASADADVYIDADDALTRPCDWDLSNLTASSSSSSSSSTSSLSSSSLSSSSSSSSSSSEAAYVPLWIQRHISPRVPLSLTKRECTFARPSVEYSLTVVVKQFRIYALADKAVSNARKVAWRVHVQHDQRQVGSATLRFLSVFSLLFCCFAVVNHWQFKLSH
jgi:serine/threonine protein kinase